MKQSYCDYISPYSDLELEDSILILVRDTPSQDDAPPYQVWVQKDELLRGYLLDKAGRQIHEETDTRTRRFQYIPPPPLPAFFTWCVTKPERGLKQSFTYFENAMKQQKGMESVVKAS